MSSESLNLVMAGSRKRRIKDKLAKYGVTTGGALVLVALLLIFFYLLYVVKPIFNGASMEAISSFELPTQGKTTVVVCSGGNVDPDLFARILNRTI